MVGGGSTCGERGLTAMLDYFLIFFEAKRKHQHLGLGHDPETGAARKIADSRCFQTRKRITIVVWNAALL